MKQIDMTAMAPGEFILDQDTEALGLRGFIERGGRINCNGFTLRCPDPLDLQAFLSIRVPGLCMSTSSGSEVHPFGDGSPGEVINVPLSKLSDPDWTLKIVPES